MPRTKKPKVIGASTSTSKRQWPQGLPEGLVVRGTGQTLLDKLDTMGEHTQDLVGVVILHVNIETHEVLHPGLPAGLGGREWVEVSLKLSES